MSGHEPVRSRRGRTAILITLGVITALLIALLAYSWLLFLVVAALILGALLIPPRGTGRTPPIVDLVRIAIPVWRGTPPNNTPEGKR